MHSSKLEFYEVFQKKKEENFHNKSLFYIEIYISHIDDFSLGKLYISEIYFCRWLKKLIRLSMVDR